MLEALVISQAILLTLVIVLGALLFATIRQLGVLYERVAPLGALTLPQAVRPGDRLPPLWVTTVAGARIALGQPEGSSR